ncbi:hypothetical protein H0H93_001779, partial [Arthromyces matolae]
QREKLNSFTQGHRSVRDYVSELDKKFLIVGADSKRARVVKLFNGFRPAIKKVLLREHMNSKYTSWKAMVREAEYQELAENVDVRESQHTSNDHGSNKHSKKNTSDNKEEGTSKGSGSFSNQKKSNFHGRKTNRTAGGGSPSRNQGGSVRSYIKRTTLLTTNNTQQ